MKVLALTVCEGSMRKYTLIIHIMLSIASFKIKLTSHLIKLSLAYTMCTSV